MKKPLYSRFSFEMVFACTIVAVFILPAIVYGQSNQKRTEVIIENGDTTVNGKKTKDMTASERKDAFGVFNSRSLGKPKVRITRKGDKMIVDTLLYSYINPYGGKNDIYVEQTERNKPRRLYRGDALRRFKITPEGIDSVISKQHNLDSMANSGNVYTYRGPQDRMPRLKPDMRNYNMPTLKGKMYMTDPADIPSPRYRFTPHNEQNFTFNNVDVNGIATNITFNVADASLNEAKKVNVTKADLTIKDLTLTPEFSTGKTWLMFTVDSKATTTVQFTDSEGKVIWSDKSVDSTFRKSFSLPVNGLYLLKVQQGGKVAVKRIVKE